MALRRRKSAGKMISEKNRITLAINGDSHDLDIDKIFAKHGSIVLK